MACFNKYRNERTTPVDTRDDSTITPPMIYILTHA